MKKNNLDSQKYMVFTFEPMRVMSKQVALLDGKKDLGPEQMQFMKARTIVFIYSIIEIGSWPGLRS